MKLRRGAVTRISGSEADYRSCENVLVLFSAPLQNGPMMLRPLCRKVEIMCVQGANFVGCERDQDRFLDPAQTAHAEFAPSWNVAPSDPLRSSVMTPRSISAVSLSCVGASPPIGR
jgi:hypothetical protein